MLNLLFSNPLYFLLFLGSLLGAIAIHEAAHAWAANRLGDPTAKMSGRLTLNPLAHLDTIGTLLLVFVGVGWGKPVPVDSYNLDNPRRDEALISLAGPASNLLTALILSFSGRLIFSILLPSISLVNILFFLLIQINISLGIFNLIPLQPLDGSKILIGLLPQEAAIKTDIFLKRFSMPLLLLALIPFGGQSIIDLFLLPAISTLSHWLTPFPAL